MSLFKETETMTRVRFAPSPTGYLHIGGARTALFNWLFARREGGAFILRIEDTDVERSSAAMVEGILEGLRWLGLDWDEGPFFQSQRLLYYRELAEGLVRKAEAYRCFCPPQAEASAEADEEQPAERVWRYDQRCRKLEPAEAQRRASSGEPHAIRLKAPADGLVGFQDRVFGDVELACDQIEDFVILRSDGTPTYHLSVVADDIDMGITHVIRGVDHLLNTTKHLLLYRAFGQAPPAYVHLPLILGPDKKRLSKRHGATSVMEYSRMGFLPQAVRNYLALLGWNPGTDQEIFTDQELIQAFDLERINKANAVFDLQKLEWMNARYLAFLPAASLFGEAKAALEHERLWQERWDGEGRAEFLALIDLLKSRCRRTHDFAHLGRSYFTDQFDYDSEAVEKHLRLPDNDKQASLRSALQSLTEAYRQLSPFDVDATERVLRGVAEEKGLKAGQLIGAVRVGLTGKTTAPGIFDVIVALGKQKTVVRLERLLGFLS
jgi:glutamyl-tRNA synthetase